MRIISQLPHSGLSIQRGDATLCIPDLQTLVVGIGCVGLSGNQKHFTDAHWFNGCIGEMAANRLQANFQPVPASGRHSDFSLCCGPGARRVVWLFAMFCDH